MLSPVECFVSEMTNSLRLGERPVDQRRRRVLYLITKWATAQGMALDREAILDPASVERFCEVALRNENSRATLRSDLRHMAPLLTRSAPWEPRPAAMAKRQLARPYTAGEVEVLRHDSSGPANTYKTPCGVRSACPRARGRARRTLGGSGRACEHLVCWRRRRVSRSMSRRRGGSSCSPSGRARCSTSPGVQATAASSVRGRRRETVSATSPSPSCVPPAIPASALAGCARPGCLPIWRLGPTSQSCVWRLDFKAFLCSRTSWPFWSL